MNIWILVHSKNENFHLAISLRQNIHSSLNTFQKNPIFHSIYFSSRSWINLRGVSSDNGKNAHLPTLGRVLLLHAHLPGLKQPSNTYMFILQILNNLIQIFSPVCHCGSRGNINPRWISWLD